MHLSPRIGGYSMLSHDRCLAVPGPGASNMNIADRRAAEANMARAAGVNTPAVWIVRGGYEAGNTQRVLYSGLTYRMACAVAKSLRSGGAWAKAERV